MFFIRKRLLLYFILNCGLFALITVAGNNSHDRHTTPTNNYLAVNKKIYTGALVAEYLFNSSLVDSSGNNHHCQGDSVRFIDDRFGRQDSAVSFSGESFIICATGGVKFNQSRTLTYWSKTTNVHQIAIGLGVAEKFDENRAFAFDITDISTANIYAGNNDIFNIQLGVYEIDEKLENLINNRWHQIAITYNGKEEIKIYADGLLIQTVVKNKANKYNTASGLVIGNWYNFDKPFRGSLDDIRIFNAVLSPLEVKTNYVNEKFQHP